MGGIKREREKQVAQLILALVCVCGTAIRKLGVTDRQTGGWVRLLVYWFVGWLVGCFVCCTRVHVYIH